MKKYKSHLKPYLHSLKEIKNQQAIMRQADDRWLKEKTQYLYNCGCSGQSLAERAIEAMALVCEASRRILNMSPYDVQVISGLAMHDGHLVEMQTGEGKTLAAILPAYLNALTGKGVHILTFNDYLARRDARWMGPVYRFLGLRVAFIQEGMSLQERKEAYQADILYLTAKEAGFDFLRDQRCLHPGDVVQQPFHFVIVDEADSLLIDEALVQSNDPEKTYSKDYTDVESIRLK